MSDASMTTPPSEMNVETGLAPKTEHSGPSFFAGIWLVTGLELRQRVRSTKWKISLGVWALVLLALTAGLELMASASYSQDGFGPARAEIAGLLYGFIAFFVLSIALLVAPTLSATSINGDRQNATLAVLHMTPLSSAQIVLGKWLAACAAGMAFVVVATPFLAFEHLRAGILGPNLLIVLLVITVLVATVCGISLGFSALISRPAGSTVLTYMVLAALVVGTPIVTAVLSVGQERDYPYEYWGLEHDGPAEEKPVFRDDSDAQPASTTPPPVMTTTTEEPEYLSKCVQKKGFYSVSAKPQWWIFAMNPYVTLADAAPTMSFDRDKEIRHTGMLGGAALGFAQIKSSPNPQWYLEYRVPQELLGEGRLSYRDECIPQPDGTYIERWTISSDQLNDLNRHGDEWVQKQVELSGWKSPETLIGTTWWLGMLVHVLLGGIGVAVAIGVTQVPIKKLSKGTRIA
ncbi:MAG: ABC transporter permease subunit [Actinomycetaceae bacterium]|nr:ABC transporter permease subunit [Actinomycetaceae bacterium]